MLTAAPLIWCCGSYFLVLQRNALGVHIDIATEDQDAFDQTPNVANGAEDATKNLLKIAFNRAEITYLYIHLPSKKFKGKNIIVWGYCMLFLLR